MADWGLWKLGSPGMLALGHAAGSTRSSSGVTGPANELAGSFAEMLRRALSASVELQNRADAEVAKLVAGESADLHRTMIAIQEAALAFDFLLAVRNKAIEAYQEIMRMAL